MKADAAISMDPVPRFPVNYANFTAMAEVGDTIFIGRYLVRRQCGPVVHLCDRPGRASRAADKLSCAVDVSAPSPAR